MPHQPPAVKDAPNSIGRLGGRRGQRSHTSEDHSGEPPRKASNLRIGTGSKMGPCQDEMDGVWIITTSRHQTEHVAWNEQCSHHPVPSYPTPYRSIELQPSGGTPKVSATHRTAQQLSKGVPAASSFRGCVQPACSRCCSFGDELVRHHLFKGHRPCLVRIHPGSGACLLCVESRGPSRPIRGGSSGGACLLSVESRGPSRPLRVEVGANGQVGDADR